MPSSVARPLLLVAALLTACQDATAPTRPVAQRPSANAIPQACNTIFGCTPTSPYENDILLSRDLPTYQDGFTVYVLSNVYDLGPFGSLVALAVGDDAVWDAPKLRIAYAGYERYGPPYVPTIEYVPKIFVMNADGSGNTQLTYGAYTASDHSPSWSPDGSRIAFVGNHDGHDHLFVMNADGSGVKQISGDVPYPGPAIYADDPAWSPDGTRIAYAESMLGPYVIRTTNPDATGKTTLVAIAGRSLRHPAWSPDGSRLAFDSPQSGACLLYVYTIATGTTTTVPATSLGGVDQCGYPRWSPNGVNLVFTGSSAGIGPHLIRVRVSDGGNVQSLTNGADFGEHDTAWR
jgi:TolB protein